MRIDYTHSLCPLTTYHAEECRVLKYVRWVDPVTAKYEEVAWPLSVENGQIQGRVTQAKTIVVLPGQRLVIINPVEDETERALTDALAVAS